MIDISISIPRKYLMYLANMNSTLYRMAGVDQREPLTEAGGYMHEQIKSRFDNESGKLVWAGLKNHTVTDRERLGYGGMHMILQRKQGLIKAATGRFHTQSGGGDVHWKGTTYKGTPVETIWEMDTIGGNVGGSRARNEIAQHQLTMGVAGVFIPWIEKKRPFMYFTGKNNDDVVRIFKAWIGRRIDAISQHQNFDPNFSPRGI